MRILTLSVYFAPESAASLYLGQNLREAYVKEGFEVIVYTPTPTRGISSEVRKQYKKKKYEEQLGGKVKIIRFNLYREGNNPLLRFIRYLLSCIILFLKGLFTKEIDIISVSSTPPIKGLSAVLLKKIRKVPFVYVLQDIFPDSLVGTGITYKGSLLWKIGRVIENFTYRNADKIIVISEGFKKNIMAKGVLESKIEVIYNWVDENKVISVDRSKNILFERYGLDKGKFYLTYNGNIGLTQNMDLLLKVAEMFTNIPAIHFIVMGEGSCKKEVEEKISQENLSNITLLPFQPYEEISYVYSMGDVGLVISKENIGQNSVPSKTWSIMSASRPVLASFDENSELQKIIENNNSGIFVKAGEKKVLYDAILELYTNPELGKEMGQNGRNFILENLTREIGTSKYVAAIKSVIK